MCQEISLDGPSTSSCHLCGPSYAYCIDAFCFKFSHERFREDGSLRDIDSSLKIWVADLPPNLSDEDVEATFVEPVRRAAIVLHIHVIFYIHNAQGAHGTLHLPKKKENLFSTVHCSETLVFFRCPSGVGTWSAYSA